MDSTPTLIHQTEKKWLHILSKGILRIFRETLLPSHDHNHHFRVWHYAKDLLLITGKSRSYKPYELENLIIASFFHDAGMTVTTDKKHGLESRKQCESFFRAYRLPIPKHFDLALEAIEHHDNKDYPEKTNSHHLTLKALLSAADDMDAFGFIGIIRYAEIYFMRNIPLQSIGEEVLSNARKRFNHFKSMFQKYTDFIENHRRRFNHLVTFYQGLDKNSEKRALLTQIQKNLWQNNNADLQKMIEGVNDSKTIQSFRKELKKELQQFPEFGKSETGYDHIMP